MTLMDGLFILAVLGWLCAAGALWHARRLQGTTGAKMPLVHRTEVELRLQQVTNIPARIVVARDKLPADSETV